MMQVKPLLRACSREAICRMHGIGRSCGLSTSPSEPVCFVTEKADWAIRWVGEYIKMGIDDERQGFISLTTKPAKVAHRVVHFGSQYMWLSWGRHMATNNRFVTSFFHGKPEDGPDAARHIDEFLASTGRLSKIVVSASLIERRLTGWGVDPTKLERIPIGCDTAHFKPPRPEERNRARARIGVPDGAICIGSFQKDGVGWGDGMEPKMIKGPDVFVEAVRQLARDLPVFVVLTGPARGYVKANLEKHGIPYHHTFLDDYKDVAGFHHALDLYLVTSREEGGPMALMEAMASHVPVVSTRVGQAEDLIHDGVTGGLVDSDDIDGLCEKARALLQRPPDIAQENLTAARRTVVDGFDWAHVAREHQNRVYLPLLED